MNHYRKGVAFVAASLMLALAPTMAFAASSWSAVTVNQSQGAITTGNRVVDLQQTANISTSTNLGNQAWVSSGVSGTQGAWFAGKGSQEQNLSAGTSLTWSDWRWPANAVGTATGSLDQQQVAWSNHPIKLQESGGIWLRSNVGGTHSNADATISQTNFQGVGDVSQSQHLSGRVRSEGFVDPPRPWCHWCTGASSFGGQLITRVDVIVTNLLNF